jgi:nucleoside-diphosphate-sugar epimerase
MILVTGGTGLVGSHLLYKLSQTEDRIRAIYRSEEKINGAKHVFSYYTEDVESAFSKIEWVKGDLLDIPGLLNHFEDISVVYHCAALVSFDPSDYYALRKINIEGTANIVNLSIANNIEKLCYVSSIAAIGEENPGIEITEDSPWNTEADHGPYAITKYGAEMEVWRGTQEGLNAIIVNPGIILGGGFWRSGSGSLFKRVYKGLSHYTNGITGYVDIQDVIETMTRLMNSDISNERHIVVSENWSFKEFTQTVAANLNVKPPKKEAKPWQLQIAWRLDWLRHFLRGKRRRLTKQMSRSTLSESVYSSSKVKTTIDLEFKPIEKSIQEVSRLFLREA